MITICILDKISTLLKTYITKTVLALIVLFIGFSIKAQDVDIDSLNSALFNYINSQRIAAGMEDLVLTEVMENTAQDQANYCTS